MATITKKIWCAPKSIRSTSCEMLFSLYFNYLCIILDTWVVDFVPFLILSRLKRNILDTSSWNCLYSFYIKRSYLCSAPNGKRFVSGCHDELAQYFSNYYLLKRGLWFVFSIINSSALPGISKSINFHRPALVAKRFRKWFPTSQSSFFAPTHSHEHQDQWRINVWLLSLHIYKRHNTNAKESFSCDSRSSFEGF